MSTYNCPKSKIHFSFGHYLHFVQIADETLIVVDEYCKPKVKIQNLKT